MEAQLTATNSLPLFDNSWTSRAITSFPTPVSPVIRTVMFLSANFSTFLKISRMPSDFPTTPWNVACARSSSLDSASSLLSFLVPSTLFTMTFSSSRAMGLMKKSVAPRWIASIAFFFVPWAVMIRIGTSAFFLTSSMAVRPSMPGSFISMIMRSVSFPISKDASS
ncbi:MAG: hypothetical protein A4E62_02958 [Syntrophorhabdus sp. PtaU1.Bin002]|nr:MAG: hypothetical protein A4E62_02958 [Syntrophorhabdus sp. PtaU1.Bin002]